MFQDYSVSGPFCPVRASLRAHILPPRDARNLALTVGSWHLCEILTTYEVWAGHEDISESKESALILCDVYSAIEWITMPDTPRTEHLATQTPPPPSAGRAVSGVPGGTSLAEPFPFSLSVGQIYNGPLDVLLALIRKQDIDIYDIPIAKITSQFLAYVDQLQANEVDTAAEFVYVAAQLIHIKSKVLLPRPVGDQSEGQPEDPRSDLVNRLLEHERFKQAAQMLQEKQQLEEATWSNPGMRGFFDDDEPVEESVPESTSEGSFDLVAIFRQVAERAASRPTLDVDADSVTVSQMVDYLHRRLLIEDNPVMFTAILGDTPSHRIVTAAFLALLEMVRVGAILLRQERIDGDIRIKKTADFEQVMSQSIAIDELWT